MFYAYGGFRRGCDYLIVSCLFGTVEGIICLLDYLLRLRVGLFPLSHSDAEGNGGSLLRGVCRFYSIRLFSWTLPMAKNEAIYFDPFPQTFKMRNGFVHKFVREYHSEPLAAAAESYPTAGYLHKF